MMQKGTLPRDGHRIAPSALVGIARSTGWLLVASLVGGLAAVDWLWEQGWWLTWIAFAMVWILGNRFRPGFTFLLGFVFGCVKMSSAFWWAEDMLSYTLNTTGSTPKMVFWGLVIWEALPFAIVLSCTAALRQRTHSPFRLLLPICLWVCFGAFWPRVFTWEIGHTLLGHLPLAQLADVGGASILTFLVLIISMFPLLLIERHQTKDLRYKKQGSIALVFVLACTALAYTYGFIQLYHWNARLSLPTDVVLGCVQDQPAEMTSLARLRNATDRFGESVDLVLWPESCLGTHSIDLKSFADSAKVNDLSLHPLVDTSHTIGLSAPLLAGGKTYLGEPIEGASVYQTAFLVATDGTIMSRYYKRGLMPLGEYVPGESKMPWLHDWFQLGDQFLFGESDSPVTFNKRDGNQVRMGVLICYEDIAPAIVRRTCWLDAQFLVCIINASAFERTVALDQHMRLGQLRTIENRRYLVRVSGTGVTCTIKPTGEVSERLPHNQPDSMVAHIHSISDRTLSMRWGNWFAWFCSSIVVVGFFGIHYSPLKRLLEQK